MNGQLERGNQTTNGIDKNSNGNKGVVMNQKEKEPRMYNSPLMYIETKRRADRRCLRIRLSPKKTEGEVTKKTKTQQRGRGTGVGEVVTNN